MDYSDDGREFVRIFASTAGGGTISAEGHGEFSMRNDATNAKMSISANDGGINIDMFYRDDTITGGLAYATMRVSKKGGLIYIHDNNGRVDMSPRQLK